jgi:hypothetical protein
VTSLPSGVRPDPSNPMEAMTTDTPAYRPIIRPVLVAACLLLVPLVAMQLTDQVNWSVADFVVAGALLAGTGVLYELAARKPGNLAYRAAIGLALAAALLLVWVNLAVGIIGSEQNPANLMYLAVLAVGAVGAAAARLRPAGMARALIAMAVAQALVAGIALVFGLGAPETGTMELVGANGLFVALFAGSAFLFRRAAP